MAGEREANPEILKLSERVAKLETDMRWVRELLEKVDKRSWYILAGIIVSILVSILARLI